MVRSDECDENFKTKYLWELTEPSEEYLLCYKYLIKYYYECEKYEQSVCSGRNKQGEAIPINSNEMVLINKFAFNKHKEILGICTNSAAYERAKQDASRLSLVELERECNRLWRGEA